MTVGDFIRHPLGMTHDLATKKVIKQFARKFNMVYFGYVSQHGDEHQLIRGVTLSPTHTDNHFCVGQFKGHDISLVTRVDELVFPGKPNQKYDWVILQIDLKRSDLPHVFVDAGHYGEVFYDNLLVKYATFMNASGLFADHDPELLKQFRVLAPPDKFEDVDQMMTKELTATLAHHFKNFDFEINGDQLLIYSVNTAITMNLLLEMLRVGVWLADKLNQADIEDHVKTI